MYKVGMIINSNANNTITNNQLEAGLKKVDKKMKYLVTYAGSLTFILPSNFNDSNVKHTSWDDQSIINEAEKVINTFLSGFSHGFDIFEYTDIFVIGIDGCNDSKAHIELIAIIEKNKEIVWTGKSYPTNSQEKTLIKVIDYNTHILTRNNDRVLILGCHDLHIFCPRAITTLGPIRTKMRTDYKNVIPHDINVVLHLPHFTITSKSWKQSMNKLIADYNKVESYGTGIYYNTTSKKGCTKYKVQSTLGKKQGLKKLTDSLSCGNVVKILI